MSNTELLEKVKGVVERVTYHNSANGWSVLKVTAFGSYGELVTVTVHQTRVFAGATMLFTGNWSIHPKFGRQFRARYATEIKPASSGALEKYLGSGLIKGVGPKTAGKIVRHFGADTLEVFENDIQRLVEVPGIASKKLESIVSAWKEHSAIREVMIFLQSYGISTLFAVRIFQHYGEEAIAIVSKNPYRLARDFYGIGFFTADKVALNLGFEPASPLRVSAAITHILSASRESGDCFLTEPQVAARVNTLLQSNVEATIPDHLLAMESDNSLKVRHLEIGSEGQSLLCYYARSVFYDEQFVCDKLTSMIGRQGKDLGRARLWIDSFCRSIGLTLSPEQVHAVTGIADQRCAILTGGPGCGKTTVTKVIAAFVAAMGCSVLLAAPTGRAAQRMEEVIGIEAKTIHRLLEFKGNGFQRNESNPLKTDLLIIDECSMLDITLAASLLRAVGDATSLLLIGDADQLPSVGAGNVLRDCISSGIVPCYQLNTVFRQAGGSLIIQAAHSINRGETPKLDSPFKRPEIWTETDCFFIDSDEATLRELRFIDQVKRKYGDMVLRESVFIDDPFGVIQEKSKEYSPLSLPSGFEHVNLTELATADSTADALLVLAKTTHPWSSLYYGLTVLDVVLRLYREWVPKYLGAEVEIQVLSPMNRGSLGCTNLNRKIQQEVNPYSDSKAELTVGEKIFRIGDRVIHRRNNYDLKVFNGDIGVIEQIDNSSLSLQVRYDTENRSVEYQKEQIAELDHAYAITVHKSQGSEFDVVILPVATQHFNMLYRNLLYTGITRGKKMVILVGTRKALAMTVRNEDTSKRQTALDTLLRQNAQETRGRIN